MTPNRHGAAVIEFPNDLEIVITREFDAPIGRLRGIHEARACAENVRSIWEGGDGLLDRPARWGEVPHRHGDRRRNRVLVSWYLLGGEPPTRTIQTWLFDGWPDAEAVESMDLHETAGGTKLTHRLAFPDKAGRDYTPNSMASKRTSAGNTRARLPQESPSHKTPGRSGRSLVLGCHSRRSRCRGWSRFC